MLAALAVVSLAGIALSAAQAGADGSSTPPAPWDGSNPFHCTIQNAGFGTAVPDPNADPYCVHFDKTHQNVDQLGIVDFVSKEPGRTASASPKCFYFQEDHWRASVVQADQRTVVYEWVGHYFFNKATGDGGAWVAGFKVSGQTFDPSQLPGFPPAYGPYFGPGTGGVITHDDVPVDPNCVALAKQKGNKLYSATPNAPRCVPAAGHVAKRQVGPLTLGTTDARVRAALGPPRSVKRGFLHYCVKGGGSLLAGEPGDRSGAFGSDPRARMVILLTTTRRFALRGRRHSITVGSSKRALLRAFPRAHKLLRAASVTVFTTGPSGVIAGITSGRVTFLAAYDQRAIRTRAAIAGYLGRAG